MRQRITLLYNRQKAEQGEVALQRDDVYCQCHRATFSAAVRCTLLAGEGPRAPEAARHCGRGRGCRQRVGGWWREPLHRCPKVCGVASVRVAAGDGQSVTTSIPGGGVVVAHDFPRGPRAVGLVPLVHRAQRHGLVLWKSDCRCALHLFLELAEL